MFDYEEAMRKIEAIVEALVQASAQLNASGSQSIEIPSLREKPTWLIVLSDRCTEYFEYLGNEAFDAVEELNESERLKRLLKLSGLLCDHFYLVWVCSCFGHKAADTQKVKAALLQRLNRELLKYNSFNAFNLLDPDGLLPESKRNWKGILSPEQDSHAHPPNVDKLEAAQKPFKQTLAEVLSSFVILPNLPDMDSTDEFTIRLAPHETRKRKNCYAIVNGQSGCPTRISMSQGALLLTLSYFGKADRVSGKLVRGAHSDWPRSLIQTIEPLRNRLTLSGATDDKNYVDVLAPSLIGAVTIDPSLESDVFRTTYWPSVSGLSANK